MSSFTVSLPRNPLSPYLIGLFSQRANLERMKEKRCGPLKDLDSAQSPEEKVIEWLWWRTDRKQIKPTVRGGRGKGQEGDEEDNITDGPSITDGSEVTVCIRVCCQWFKSINNLSYAMMCLTSDLKEGHCRSSMHGAILYRGLICQVIYWFYRHLHPLNC